MSSDKKSEEISQEFYLPFLGNALRVKASSEGVSEIYWLKNLPKKSQNLNPLQKKIKTQVDQFASGKAPLNLSIDWKNLEGTDFQKTVWKKMAKIPYGKTKSYGEIAQSLKKPGAARAVGTACGKNPVLLAIPCHRVVGTNGLGGFSGGGLPVKRKLLSLEGVQAKG